MRTVILTAAALIVLGLAGCKGAPAFMFGTRAETPTTPEGQVDAPALIRERCTWCHSAARIDEHHFDRAGWGTTVTAMRRKGARLTDAEQAALVDFLTERDRDIPKTPAGD